VTNFWWDNYGLGVCNAKRENETKRNINKLSKLYDKYFVCEKGRWMIPGDAKSSSSKTSSSSSRMDSISSSSFQNDKPSSSSSSGVILSGVEGSSSSIYNPFNQSSSSSSKRLLPELSVNLDFFDDFCKVKGSINFSEGKQKVWMLNCHFYASERRDSIASVLVDSMGTRGFVYEGSVRNDSLSWLLYDSLSYVYSLRIDNLVYKISFTKFDVLGIDISRDFDVKVVVLENGFEEIPTTDYNSLRYVTEFPEELVFMDEFASTKERMDYDDDSLMVAWRIRHDIYSEILDKYEFIPEPAKEKEAEKELTLFRAVLPDNGFTFVKSDSMGRNSYMSDSIVVRYFYEMETSIAKYELVAEVGTIAAFYLSKYSFRYGYTVNVRTYYKQKPERKKN
jgi:hypothetical protein